MSTYQVLERKQTLLLQFLLQNRLYTVHHQNYVQSPIQVITIRNELRLLSHVRILFLKKIKYFVLQFYHEYVHGLLHGYVHAHVYGHKFLFQNEHADVCVFSFH